MKNEAKEMTKLVLRILRFLFIEGWKGNLK